MKNIDREIGFNARITRRNVVQIGGLGLLGMTLPEFFQAQSVAATRAETPLKQRIKSCIFIFYYGGPSHLDTFDMKPQAPVDVRGEFKPISTSVPGLHISEHLPHTARIMHKLSVVRSMHHRMRAHDSASYQTLTGRVPPVGDQQGFSRRPDLFPCYGSCLGYVRRNLPNLIPHAALPFVMNNNIENAGQTAGFLGRTYQPLLIPGDPETLTYRAALPELGQSLTRQRLFRRDSLRRSLNSLAEWPASTPSMDVFHERAADLLSSNTVRNALKIQQESATTRDWYGFGEPDQPYIDNSTTAGGPQDGYGRNLRGLNLLLARRLVEAGVPFVNVYDYKQQGLNWDTHQDNSRLHKEYLLPPADRSFAALIQDLDQRGLLETTLVVAVGEFGRTPRFNKKAGRDHWPDCYSAVLAGGPIKGGYVYGSSDRLGAYPASDPVTPENLAATIFTLFGIPPTTKIRDLGGRPFHSAEGKPVAGLFA